MDPVTILGVVGAIIILTFFLLNQFHILDADSFVYDLGNVVGSLILLIYSYLILSILFLIINAVWLVFSLYDVVRRGGK
jgi:hypothetical protein